MTKEYSNGEITVVWKPDLCIHSQNCFKGLPQVFHPKKRPWVNMEGANTDAIAAQVDKCPSGALSYYRNGEKPKADDSNVEQKVEVVPNGPLMVHGNIMVKHADKEESRQKVTAFCRCGGSSNKPYCDGSHKKIDFQG